MGRTWVHTKLKKLKKGRYACPITEVRDADGEVVCDEPADKRRVTVKWEGSEGVRE